MRALIFDVDGTLAETEELHRAAFNLAFRDARLGWHWDPPLYAELLAVTGGKERIRYAIERGARPALDAAAIATLHAAKTAHYTSGIGAIPLRPGISRLLDEAEASGVTLAIATTTSPANVQALLHATLGANGPARFAVIGAGDVVPRKKPAPDIYAHVLRQLSLAADQCLAIEDTPQGLQAAQGAGICTVITRSLYGGSEGFCTAAAVLDDLAHTSLVQLRAYSSSR